MTKILQRLQLLLPAAVIVATVIGSLWMVTKVSIGLLNEQAVASQDVVLRELTTNEIYRIYLFEKVDENHKTFWQLARIIKCESGWNEMAYNPKSNDFGLLQINYKTWNEKAIELGLENYTDYWQDNLNLGVWIFEHYGTQPWNWSKKCWNGK